MNNLVIITSYIDTKMSLSPYIKGADFTICLDGGWDIIAKENVLPDLIMGDMDSIVGELPESVPTERFKPEKDYTDLELALKKAEEFNAKNVTVIGGIGGRLDHTVANLQLLSNYCGSFDDLIMIDGRNKCFVLDSKKKNNAIISCENNSYISLFSLSPKCTGVSISGVKYPLNDYILTSTFPLGVSNEFKEKDAALCIKDGTLLVVISKK